jgi:N-acyl homoserine lactone hydrolase
MPISSVTKEIGCCGTRADDDLVSEPDGRIIAHGILGIVRKTVASQLEEIGVAPDDIETLAISHAHFDHVGNCRLFRKARWIAQRAEYNAMFGANAEEFGYSPELYATLTPERDRTGGW